MRSTPERKSNLDLNEVEPYFLLAISGLLIRQTLIFADQAWAKSYAQTISFMLLPVITFIITKTISGNIALSLGMIGALSIVRFRHPVKSALELIIYFDLITIGIATSVRTKWALQLLICSVLIILLVKFVQKISNNFGRSFYNMSFNEGNVTNTLKISSKERIDFVEKNNQLSSSLIDNKNKEFIYRMNFENRKELEKFESKLKEFKFIEKINIVIN